MSALIKFFAFLFLVWLVCRFFYSLGRKSALNEKGQKNESTYRRKKVKSTVVEKDSDLATENTEDAERER